MLVLGSVWFLKKNAQIFPSQKKTHHICPFLVCTSAFNGTRGVTPDENTKWWRSDRSQKTIQSHQRIKVVSFQTEVSWKELFMKFHWKILFWAIFLFTAFFPFLGSAEHTLNTERRHRMSWTKHMSISVSWFSSHKCFSNHAWITKPLQFRNLIKTISDKNLISPFFSATMCDISWACQGFLRWRSAHRGCQEGITVEAQQCHSRSADQTQGPGLNAAKHPQGRGLPKGPNLQTKSDLQIRDDLVFQKCLGVCCTDLWWVNPIKCLESYMTRPNLPLTNWLFFTQALLASHLLVVLIQRIWPFQSL